MATVTTPPRGLISLFGLRDMGAVPNDLAGTIAPTIDITEFALTNRDAVFLGSVGAASPGLHTPTGGTVDPTVPPGELWYVHQFSVAAVTAVGAGITVHFRPVMIDSTLYFARGARVTGTAGENPITMSDRMFLATPGQSLRIWVEGITGGAVTLSAYALITRLKI
jgi:hypothetical protein